MQVFLFFFLFNLSTQVVNHHARENAYGRVALRQQALPVTSHFSRFCDLQDHIRVHAKEKPHGCDVCHLAYRRRSDVLQHRQLPVAISAPDACLESNKCFARKSSLRTHLVRVHRAAIEQNRRPCIVVPPRHPDAT